MPLFAVNWQVRRASINRELTARATWHHGFQTAVTYACRYADEMAAATQDLIDGPWEAAAAAGSSQANSSRAQHHAAGGNSSMSPSVRDVYADFNQLTLNITLAALFGLKDTSSYTTSSSSANAGSSSSNGSSKRLTDSETAARVVSAVERAFTYFAARGATAMVVPEWVPTPNNVAFKEAVQQLDDLVYGIIDARQAENSKQRQGADASSSSSSRTDLLQALLDSTDEAGRPMAKTALRDELMTLLVAGQEVRGAALQLSQCALHCDM
jgi:cytochrome P450